MTWPDDDDLLKKNIEAADEEEITDHRYKLITLLISVLVLLAMLASLILPLLRTRLQRLPRPTPTPTFLQEAQVVPDYPEITK